MSHETNFPNTHEEVFQSSYDSAAREFHPILDLSIPEIETRVQEIQDSITEEYKKWEILGIQLMGRKLAIKEIEEALIPSIRRRIQKKRNAEYQTIPVPRSEKPTPIPTPTANQKQLDLSFLSNIKLR